MPRTFYRCTNQGITAVVTEEVYDQIQTLHQTRTQFSNPQDLIDYPKPIFTFVVDLERDDRWKYLVGDLEVMDRLLRGQVVAQRKFYVPFSGTRQHSTGLFGKAERSFRTTLKQIMDAFGLVTQADLAAGLGREFEKGRHWTEMLGFTDPSTRGMG